MKMYFNKQKRLRLSVLVLSGLLYGSVASAANLVSAVPSDYGNSDMGAVTGSRVTTDVDATPHASVLKNLNRDPASFGFHQKGKSMILLRQYTYSTTNLEGTLLIDPNSEGAAAAVARGKTTAVPNMHAAAASDEYIYLTGYDLGQIGVVRRSGEDLIENRRAIVNLKADIKKYCGYNFTETFKNLDEDQFGVKGKTYTGDPERAMVHGEALLVEGRKLYVAASVNPLGGYDPYDDGFLMQYDIQNDGSLKFGSYTRISRNIDQGRLNKFNDHILVSCIGGYQHYNGTGNTHHTAINVAKIDESGKLTSTTQRRVKLPKNVTDTGQDMRDLKILPNGTAYVMTYNLSPSGSQINVTVYQTTVSNLLSDDPADWKQITSVGKQEGWFGKLNAEYYTKRLWLELGDTLSVLTDGDDAAKYTWQAKDFSDNKAFARFNKITMIEPDWVYGNTASVVLAVPAELGGGTAAPAPNPNAVWKTGGNADSVTGTQTYGSDTLINIGKDKIGNKTTNVLAAIYAADGNIDINAAGHKLNLQVENTIGNPTGIYAGNGKNVTVNASEVNIITKGFANGNTLTNAIQLDAAKNAASGITINAPVNISMTGGLGGNGVAVQKSDRFGEKSYEAKKESSIRIAKDLKIAGASTDQWGIPINRENVFSRFNNAGILTQVEKSSVTVGGDADMTVYGNGVTTNAKDSKVTIAGGGSIQVPAGMKYSYYALAAYKGAINMNMGENGQTPGNGKTGIHIADVKLDGDLFALSTGRLNVALLTNKSYLHGLVDNGGTANLYLQNGATWINEGRNARYYQDDEDKGAGTVTGGKYIGKSRITNFFGGTSSTARGVIYQKDADALNIDNYSGHALAVYKSTGNTVNGGDIIVDKAQTGSVLTLRTAQTAGAQTNALFEALANKLMYRRPSEGLLTGRLELGEGLIAPSATGDIAFNGAGKGIYNPAPTAKTTPLTAAEATAGTYTLAGNEMRDLTHENVIKGFGNKWSVLANYDKDGAGNKTTGLTVDLKGHTLTLGMTSAATDNHYIAAIYAGKETVPNPAHALTIKDTQVDGKVVISAKHAKPSRIVDGIYADQRANINIEAPVEIKSIVAAGPNAHGVYAGKYAKIKLKDLTIKEVVGSDGSAIGLTAYGIGAGDSAEVDVDTVNISGVSGAAVYGMSSGSPNTKINIGGGKIIAKKATAPTNQYWAVHATTGTVTLNKGKNRNLVVEGNMQAGDNTHAGNIDASFTTDASSWKGAIHKVGASNTNLTLSNGATWTHEVQSGKLVDAAGFTASHLTKFTGGDSPAHAGVVRQGAKNILIDNYSGHTRFIFDHDAATPTTIKGGTVTITKAEDNSHVTLSTNPSANINDGNIKNVLNALANKLTYTDYKTGKRQLKGTVEVNEGLTSSSAKWAGDILFKDADGQGSYDPNATPSQPANEQQKTEFTSQITSGDVAEYVNEKVEKSTGVYTFTKDTTIKSKKYNGAIYGDKNPVTINAVGKRLNIEAKLTEPGFLTGIYHYGTGFTGSADSGAVNIQAGTLNLDIKGTGRTYGIYNTGNGLLRIKGQTNIDISGGTDEDDEVTGIETSSRGTTILEGLTIRQEKSTENHRAIRNTGLKSKLYVNIDEAGILGANKVDIQGNVLTDGFEAVTNLALTTADSKLHGTLRVKDGTLNLWLANGATWTNENYGKRSGLYASKLTKLTGGAAAAHAGNVYMREDKDLTVKNYEGHTNFFFEHDAASPAALKGGNVKIEKAAAGSHATMITEHTGVNASNLTDVMKALARKLYYMDSEDSHNLSGTVKVLEGLTASSAQVTNGFGYIAFGTDHRGVYSATAPVYQDQTKTAFATPITNTNADTEYAADGVRKTDGRYVFTQDKTTITTGGASIAGGPSTPNINAAISNTNTTNPLKINMKGHDLAVHINATSHTTGISAIGDGSEIVIDNAGDLSVNSVGTGMDAALFANGGGKITINAKEGKTIRLRTEAANKANGAVVKTMNGAAGARSSITLNGQVDIEADGVKSNEGLSAVASDIRVAGGTIKATGGAQYAIRAYGEFTSTNDGRVYVNTVENGAGQAMGAKTNKTVLVGNISTSGSMSGKGKGIVNLGLNTADSSWTGDYAESNDGTVNLWMGSNATWTGKTGANSNLNMNLLYTGSLWKLTGTSHVKNLAASSSEGRNVFDMRGTAATDKLNIDQFGGKGYFLYGNTVTTTHDADTDTDVKHVTVNGADVHVKKAERGSEITLHTASNGKWDWTISAGAVEKNLTSRVVKMLANKLYYEGAITKEDNLALKVKVGEGLTTSSAARTFTKADGLTFNKTTGQADYVYTPVPEPLPSTEIKKTKTLTKDFVASATEAHSKDDGGNPIVSALYAGSSAYTKANPMIVDMNGHSLKVQAESDDKLARAINLAANSAVEIKNTAKKTLTISAINKGTRAATGIDVGANSSLKIQGPVVIDEVRANNLSVSAITTRGSIGQSGEVTIDGDLTVKKLEGKMTGNGSDGRNLSALHALGGKSAITVTGNADIQNVKGSVIRVAGSTGYEAGGTVNIGGGTLSAAADADKSKQYRVLTQQTGTVNINMNGAAAGTRKTVLKGDMYAVSEYGKKSVEYGGGSLAEYNTPGTLNVALTTADSSWHGAMLYETTSSERGTGGVTNLKAADFRFHLQNGASWTNEQLSGVGDTWKGSRVKKLTGGSDAAHAGVIFQKDAKDITIDEYSGHTKVFYRHTVNGDTATMQGGGITISKAAAGSEITLVTDKNDLDLASPGKRKRNLVNATLNALAGKLQYAAYKSGERHLSGKAVIADGLTASSASLRMENITFDSSTGQGRYNYTPLPYNQIVTSFTTPVTGDASTDAAYFAGGVLDDDGSYSFTLDTTITGTNGVKGSSAHKIDAATAAGKTLTIRTSGAALDAGAGSNIALGGGKTVMETTGTHVIDTAAGSKTALKGAFDIKGAVRNAGVLTLDDKEGTSRLAGDIENSGTLSLSLKGANSTYTGALRGSGASSLTLGSAARWTNTGASKLRAFSGTQGGIVDMRSSGDTRIESYSGNSTFWYGHTIAEGVDRDGEKAKVPAISGGKLTIASAAAGSEIHLRTDNAGYNFDSTKAVEKNLISATLNGLANKLYYENYAAQPSHLKAYVEIGEGLIGSGARISKEITTFGKTTEAAHGKDFQGKDFNTENKQGAYVYTPSWDVPDTQKTTDFTSALTGDWNEAAQTGADLVYAKGGVIHGGKYGFTKDTKIHPAAGSGITNAASKKDIAIKAQGANLTVEAADWAIEAAKDHKIDLTSDKRVTLNGMGVLSAASGSAVKVEAAGLTLSGVLQNDGGKVTLNGGNAKSTFSGNLSQSGGGSLLMHMKGAGSSFAGNVLNLGGSVRIDLSGDNSSFRGMISGPADTADVSGLRSAKTATPATTELILGKAANVEFTGASKVKTLTVGENSVVKAPDGKELKVDTLNTGSGSTVMAQTGTTLTAGALAANGSLKLAADGNIRTDKLTMSGGTIQKVGGGTAAVKEAEVTKETTLDAAATGMSFDKLSLGNAMLKNTGAADISVKKLSSNTGGRLFLGSDAKVQAEEISGDINVLKEAKVQKDGTVTANSGKLTFKKVDAAQANKLTLSAVGMTLEDARTGTAEEQKAKKERNQNALLSFYKQTVKADVASDGIAKGNTYKDAEGKEHQGYRIKNLNVNLATMESLTGSSAMAFGNILFDSAGNAVSVAEQQIGYGDYETMVMQSTKGAMTSSMMVWRNEMNDLMKRMGDLRLSPEDTGAWVHFYRGKTSSDKNKASFRMNYTTIQAGYDWKAGKDWRVGVAGSYMKGSSSYATGSGDNKAGNFAVYGTWTGRSGEYVDIIAKIGRMANDFSVTNEWGNVTAKGDYHTWGESVSAEYGRRFHRDNGYYFEPQVEMTFGHMNGVNYDMTSNGYGTLQVEQSGLTSVIGRLGIAMGQETKRGTWFLKASLYHEFAGDMDTTWKVTGNPTKYTKQDGKDTWVGIQLGGTVKLNDRTSLYGDFEKTFGGDIKTNWRVDAGLRWSF